MADNRVYIATCDDYSRAFEAVGRCLEGFGGAAVILAGRKRVLVKPNLVMPRNPDAAATTHPAVLAAVCKFFTDAGAEVSLIDSTAFPHTQGTLKMLYSGCRLDGPIREAGAALSYDVSVRQLPSPNGKMVKSFNILAPIADAELVVSVGKAKTHGFTAFTGAAKNLFGAIPGTEKAMYHKRFPGPDDFGDMLVDLNECVSPGFAVLDAVVGMEGQGPTGGTPKKLGAILAGINPFAVDLAACHLMSVRLERVAHLCCAQKRGHIPKEQNGLDWLGDAPDGLVTVFRPAGDPETAFMSTALHTVLPRRLTAFIRKKRAPWPSISSRCTGCGNCARVCPEKIIKIRNKKAEIDNPRCIKCYCCHEFCPAKAIDYVKKP